MKRIRLSSLRILRNHGAGVIVAALLAANGSVFEAAAQSKKPVVAPKPPAAGKPAKPAPGSRPPASDDLYEGPPVPAAPTKPSAIPETVTVPANHPSKYADAWPSEYRPVAADLGITQLDENKAAAIAAFAEATGYEERGMADKALRAFQKAASLDPADPRLAIKVARELLKTNDPTAAIQVIKDSISAAPKEPKTLLYLASIYATQLNKPELAKQYSEKALEIAPEYFPAWKSLLDLVAGDAKKTAELIERVAKSPSRDAEFWLEFALFLRKDCGLENRKTPTEDEKKRIESVYQKALEIAPKNAAAIAQFGDYFALSRDHKRAIVQFEQALALKQAPTHPALENLREKLAIALVADGRKSDALPMLERLVADFPGRSDLGNLLAEVYEQTGQIDKALEYYKRSLSLDLTRPDNHIDLAQVLVREKRFDAAVATLQSAREKFADRPDVTYALARALSLAKKHQLSMDMFAAAQKEMKGRNEDLANETFYFQYGAAAEQAGQLEKAAELLKKCIELKPDSPEAYNYLGYMWADRGEQLEEAGTLIKKAVELDPENAAYLDSLGWWYFKTGKFEEAKKELSRAVEIMGAEEDATVLDHLADAVEKLGKKDEAVKLWKRALKLDSDIQDKIAKKITDAEKR